MKAELIILTKAVQVGKLVQEYRYYGNTIDALNSYNELCEPKNYLNEK